MTQIGSKYSPQRKRKEKPGRLKTHFKPTLCLAASELPHRVQVQGKIREKYNGRMVSLIEILCEE